MSATTSVEVGRVVPPATRVFRDPARVEELTDSIRVVGLRCPLVVRRLNDHAFELVDGVLRHEAVDALGWREVPALVVDLDDRAAARMRLVLNAVRRCVSPLEEGGLSAISWTAATARRRSPRCSVGRSRGSRPGSSCTAASARRSSSRSSAVSCRRCSRARSHWRRPGSKSRCAGPRRRIR